MRLTFGQAWFGAGMLFLVGVFLGLETAAYTYHQQDAKPVFVRIPPVVEPVDVITTFKGCHKQAEEAGRKAWQQCRMNETRKRG